MVSRALVFLLSFASLAAAAPEDWPAAAKDGDTARVEALLKAGADPEAQDRDGRTALMLAAQYGHADTVRLLLARGAHAGARDKRGWNAYMLALLSPSGGIIHTVHENVLKLLPQPHLRLAVEARWAPGASFFSSCFMRPTDLARLMDGVAPDALVLQAFRDYAFSSGRGLVELLQTTAGADAVLSLLVEPGVTCVGQSDRLSLSIHVSVLRPPDQPPLLERAFGGGGVQTGIREELAANPAQYPALYRAWAKSQAGAIYWSVVEAVMRSQPVP